MNYINFDMTVYSREKKFHDLKLQMQEQKINKYKLLKHFITEFKNLVNENRFAHEMQSQSS